MHQVHQTLMDVAINSVRKNLCEQQHEQTCTHQKDEQKVHVGAVLIVIIMQLISLELHVALNALPHVIHHPAAFAAADLWHKVFDAAFSTYLQGFINQLHSGCNQFVYCNCLLLGCGCGGDIL